MININKYWIGYLTGILIILNIFSAGVILSNNFSLNWKYFIWIYCITALIIAIIIYVNGKQEKQLKKMEENNENNK